MFEFDTNGMGQGNGFPKYEKQNGGWSGVVVTNPHSYNCQTVI